MRAIILFAILSLAICQNPELPSQQPMGPPQVAQQMAGEQDARTGQGQTQVLLPANVITVEAPHHQHHPQAQVILVEQKPQQPQQKPVIIVEQKPDHQQPHHKPEPMHDGKDECRVFGRPGKCFTLYPPQNIFNCFTQGGVVGPDMVRCGWTKACCLQNFF